MNSKAEIRKQILERLQAQDSVIKEEKQSDLCNQVSRLSEFNQATVVCCYVALSYEVQTQKLIEQMLKQNKRVSVPYVETENQSLCLYEIKNFTKDLTPGSFGVLEPTASVRQNDPVNPEALDLIFVPGVAFDRSGNRLGHGKGFYDRFLSGLKPSTVTIGLAYDFQLLDQLPVDVHDCPVNEVLVV